MRIKPFKLFAVFAVSLALYFGAGSGQAIASRVAMPGMEQMGSGQCQANCNVQSQPFAGKLASDIEHETDNPQPAIPYYLQFPVIGWTTTVIAGAAYLMRYLRWRPPDFTKLYSVYRF